MIGLAVKWKLLRLGLVLAFGLVIALSNSCNQTPALLVLGLLPAGGASGAVGALVTSPDGGLQPMADAGGGIGDTTALVLPIANGYAFPVVGWQGRVQLHWGAVPGGSDLFAARGTPVVAMRAGRVNLAGWDVTGGWAVEITGDDGLEYYYAHFSAPPSVVRGQTVQAGTYLGPVGNTGDASGVAPHLHLGIGPSILLGHDKWGGTGGNFNAVGLLQRVLDAGH